ncbi:hypothetical protein [Nocardioides convexus]|uniref:hypothetical protein n=1 Tax=Nocardioides convexus TaxID=2712224 RepID=UPI00241843C9|nr:hypothetical protein [Nocardioides convexus]
MATPKHSLDLGEQAVLLALHRPAARHRRLPPDPRRARPHLLAVRRDAGPLGVGAPHHGRVSAPASAWTTAPSLPW